MAAATTSSRAPPPSGLLARSAMATTASQTQTQTPPLVQVRQPVLRLRGAETGVRSKKRIQWAEDVIDNEGLGRKSSKVCCIYHAPKPIDESSDESSSDDSSSDDNSGDDGNARPVGGRRGGRRAHGHDCGHDHADGKGKRKATRARSPNAYEKMPKVKEGVSTRGTG